MIVLLIHSSVVICMKEGRGEKGGWLIIPITRFLKAPFGGWRRMNQDLKLPQWEWQTGLLLPIYYDSDASGVLSGPVSPSATDSETLGFNVCTCPLGGSAAY